MEERVEKKMNRPSAKVVCDGRDLFVVFNGVRIAKRGKPKTPQARQWVSLEPGFKVYEGKGNQLVIEQLNGVALH